MGKRKTIMLLVTYGCNLNCTYCYEHKDNNKYMRVDDAKTYILDIVSALEESYNEFEIQFMGGEPLMVFPLIKEISEWLWSSSFKVPLAQIFIPTNGVLINETMKSWFTENCERICLGLSFDGDRLMQNTNRSNSYNNIDLHYFAHTWPKQSVKMTISPQTLPHLYDGTLSLHKIGFKYITADLAVGETIGWDNKHLRLFYEQLHKLIYYYVENESNPSMSFLNMNILSIAEQNFTKKCGCGESLVCVDIDGKEYACHLFSPITISKEKAQQSQEIDFNNHKFFVSKECKICALFSLCTSCYGMNYCCSNDVTKQDPFMCQAFKIQFLSTCNLHIMLAEKQNDQEYKNKIEQILTNIYSENYEYKY